MHFQSDFDNALRFCNKQFLYLYPIKRSLISLIQKDRGIRPYDVLATANGPFGTRRMVPIPDHTIDMKR